MADNVPLKDEFEFDVHCDGLFMLNPLRYDGVVHHIWLKKRISFDEMIQFLKMETDNTRLVNLYFCIPGNNIENGLAIVENDKQLGIVYDVAMVYGKLNLYVDHLGLDITEYLNEYVNEQEVEDQCSGIRGKEEKKLIMRLWMMRVLMRMMTGLMIMKMRKIRRVLHRWTIYPKGKRRFTS